MSFDPERPGLLSRGIVCGAAAAELTLSLVGIERVAHSPLPQIQAIEDSRMPQEHNLTYQSLGGLGVDGSDLVAVQVQDVSVAVTVPATTTTTTERFVVPPTTTTTTTTAPTPEQFFSSGGPWNRTSLGTFVVTCYALSPKGSRGGPGSIAVDPRVIRMGTKLEVPGYGEGEARDTGGAIKGNRLDVWMSSNTACNTWGVQRLEVFKLEPVG